MSEPLLFTIEETIHAVRIARAALEYVRRSEELSELMVKSEKPLDPKIELRTSEAWGRLLESVKAPKTGPPGKKQGVRDRRPKTATAADSIRLARLVKRSHRSAA